MLRFWPRLLLPLIAVLASCSSTEPTVVPAGQIVISGDSVLLVGAKIVLNVLLSNTGGAISSWSVNNPFILGKGVASSGNGELTLVGRSAGTAVVTVVSGAVQQEFRIRVKDERPAVPITLGTSVAGTLVNGVSTQRYTLNLVAGDTVDLMVTQSSGALGNVVLGQTSDGMALSPSLGTSVAVPSLFGTDIGGIVGARAATGTGVYSFSAFGDPYASRGFYESSGPFAFTIRRSGPILSYATKPSWIVREGSAKVTDTLLIANAGTGTLKVDLTSPAPYVKFGQSSILVTGPTASTDGASGTVRTSVSVDATSLAAGNYGPRVQLTVPPGTWSMSREASGYTRSLLVYDRRLEVLARQYLNGITTGPLGELYALGGADLFRLDSVSGATTALYHLPAPLVVTSHVAAAPDGSLYGVAAGALWRYQVSTGTLTQYPDTKLGQFIVTDDGTVYALAGTGAGPTVNLVQMSGGVPTIVAADIHGTSIAYDRADRAVYVVSNGSVPCSLRRFDLATGVVTRLFDLPGCSIAGIDAQGRFYIWGSTSLHVLDGRGAQVDDLYTLGITAEIAFANGRMYGVGQDYIWRLLLP